ncbi:TIR domain-containing protein [Bernardetia sp. OM2101]|uniref:TIR domain-containing protein n=1 Tax=Bernardetia sp. OM2101 TaxID=3344876 RepID=UPI0035CFB7DD
MSNPNYKDIFISYGRAESKYFASQLYDLLTEKGYKVWFDQNDIPLAVDFQDQIDEGIEKSDNFIFVIAPHSIRSPYCKKEIELATKYSKRIIPILHIEPSGAMISEFMHPSVSKRNWLYMRQNIEEGKGQHEWKDIDDREKGQEGLLSILESHKDYVRRHTELLHNALEWEKQYRNNRYLPFGDRQTESEQWLLTAFKDGQPPCLPSSIHCEFISEARKNSENRMTDAFISYAEEDEEIRNRVLRSLSQHLITTWTHQMDIQAGGDFDKEVENGIEQADNFIFFITHESIKSEYCKIELEHAVKYNKRIIPLRMDSVPVHNFPIEIRNLQFIDFTDNNYDFIPRSKNEKTDYEKDIDELLNQINTDRDYYHKHKIILNKAIRWKEQNHNASILLRGHNLDEAKIWLKIGLQREKHLPTRLHEEFVRESESKSGQLSTEVFISYSRADGDYARKLNDELQENGKTTWFDQESIASGADFQQEIYNGIEACENFVFIISPDSVKSPYCDDEVKFATKLGKRIITILYRATETFEIPMELSNIQWINFIPNQTNFHDSFAELIRTLDTDREHVKSHNHWYQEALQWQKQGKNNDFLLVGTEYFLAHSWYEEAILKKKIPAPNALQKEYLKASQQSIEARETEKKQVEQQLLTLEKDRNAEAKKRIERQKIFLIIAVVALLISVAAGVYAFVEKGQAERSKADAIESEKRAVENEKIARENEEKERKATLIAKQKAQQLEEALAKIDSAIAKQSVAVKQKLQAESKLAKKETSYKNQDFVKDRLFTKNILGAIEEIKKMETSLINYARQLESLGVIRPAVRQSMEKQIKDDVRELRNSLLK